MWAFALVDPTNPMQVVDWLLKPEVPFEELLTRSGMLNKTKIRIASIDDLIALKRQANRPLSGLREWCIETKKAD
jgi:hypothetical protein